ncbi:hypothetical protein G6O69_16015 [Pseudenhygromyxa sp. WMMC2535]|uniref:hypothetical protein n=1 Tax=Pseudenhygromyxa sp. WMMC2535 TaxID=2712867 RepID=UPI001552A6A8|nr:hypothetical protein [Pseudenhygromyxa sp. WMMC2535]NVB39349.1 hypothetical protein [Pseudenhygromyxa sp. WMMC2535]
MSGQAEEQGVELESGQEAGEGELFVDAATRVSKPSAFDDWYYGIEDRIGQGTIGMGICLVIFLIMLVFAITCNPI